MMEFEGMSEGFKRVCLIVFGTEVSGETRTEVSGETRTEQDPATFQFLTRGEMQHPLARKIMGDRFDPESKVETRVVTMIFAVSYEALKDLVTGDGSDPMEVWIAGAIQGYLGRTKLVTKIEVVVWDRPGNCNDVSIRVKAHVPRPKIVEGAKQDSE